MKFHHVIWFVVMLAPCRAASAYEFGAALGVMNLVSHGADIQVNYRADQGRWLYSLRYVRFEDLFIDPFSGNEHSKTRDSLIGPGVSYLFRNESRQSAYVGASFLKWTRTETPIALPGPSMTASRWDPYFGGGYVGRIGGSGYYNLGLFLAPTAKLVTQTAISSNDQSGNLDIQIQLGFVW